MKLILKLFCFIAVIGFMTLPLTGCHEEIEAAPKLPGEITVKAQNEIAGITDKFYPIHGATLEVSYIGPVPQSKIDFQWRVEGSSTNLYPDSHSMFGAGPQEFIPTWGNYTVYASANGYSSIKKNVRVIKDPSIPLADFYNFSNMIQNSDNNIITEVLIEPKPSILEYATLDGSPIPTAGNFDGAITIYYEGTGSTEYTKSGLPSDPGTYAVTFDVGASSNSFFGTAIGLKAGILVIYEQLFTTVNDLNTFIDAQNDYENHYVGFALTNNTLLSGSSSNTGSIGNIIKTIPEKKYINIYLDLSDTTITTVSKEAFFDCDRLIAVTLPEKVTSIGDNAFDDCDNLTNINIPSAVTKIGDYAFHDCKNLTNITIPKNVTSIGNNAFSDCDKLTSITIPRSVTSIGNSAFYHWAPTPEEGGLTSVTFEGTIAPEKLGDTPFPGNLREVYLRGGTGTYMREDNGIWTKQ